MPTQKQIMTASAVTFMAAILLQPVIRFNHLLHLMYLNFASEKISCCMPRQLSGEFTAPWL